MSQPSWGLFRASSAALMRTHVSILTQDRYVFIPSISWRRDETTYHSKRNKKRSEQKYGICQFIDPKILTSHTHQTDECARLIVDRRTNNKRARDMKMGEKGGAAFSCPGILPSHHHPSPLVTTLSRLLHLLAFALRLSLLPQPLLHLAERLRLRTRRRVARFGELDLVSRGGGGVLALLSRGLAVVLEPVGCHGRVGLALARAGGLRGAWLVRDLGLGSRGGDGKLGCRGAASIHDEFEGR
ncbi:hypothetical protein F4801DRAFT_343281 [Xylaria longipes]|nr:hypothetical protein F4801DRAFT_343281 [Xylaria longipes]